jgi:hypothetical protein
MSEIRSGSYGHVFKIQQKSSLGLFAIKKIAIRDEIEPFKELCTSLLISKLNSDLIVIYHYQSLNFIGLKTGKIGRILGLITTKNRT